MAARMIILGAGTALPDQDRDNTSLFWDAPSGPLLLDCGGRAYQQLLRAGVDPKTLRGVILSHNHADHIYGVPALLFHLWLGGYEGTLDVYANPSTLAMAQALCNALELEQNGHMCTTRWRELSEAPDVCVIENDAYSVITTPVEHTRPTLAVKIVDHEQGHSIVYSADTKPCATLEQLAHGAHTLIHEATSADPNNEHGHSTPRQAGAVAARGGVQRLVLIHYSAAYTMPEAQALAEVKASGFEGEVRLARELEVYDLRRSSGPR